MVFCSNDTAAGSSRNRLILQISEEVLRDVLLVQQAKAASTCSVSLQKPLQGILHALQSMLIRVLLSRQVMTLLCADIVGSLDVMTNRYSGLFQACWASEGNVLVMGPSHNIRVQSQLQWNLQR